MRKFSEKTVLVVTNQEFPGVEVRIIHVKSLVQTAEVPWYETRQFVPGDTGGCILNEYGTYLEAFRAANKFFTDAALDRDERRHNAQF